MEPKWIPRVTDWDTGMVASEDIDDLHEGCRVIIFCRSRTDYFDVRELADRLQNCFVRFFWKNQEGDNTVAGHEGARLRLYRVQTMGFIREGRTAVTAGRRSMGDAPKAGGVCQNGGTYQSTGHGHH